MAKVHNTVMWDGICLLKHLFIWFIRDVKLEYKTLKEKVKEYNRKDKQLYSKMFAKLV